jgi:hypothetical protein
MIFFWSLALISTDANLVITWSCNPQSRLRLDLGKPKKTQECGTLETCLKAPTLLKWSRMTPWSQLIFDKSNSVRSRTEEYKNHSHTLKLKNSEVIFINGSWNFGYMSLNSSWKINLNRPLMWTYMRSTQNWPKNPKLKSP